MREIKAEQITQAVKELCIKACCELPCDVYTALEKAKSAESSEIGKETLCDIIKNADIAKENTVPICQDTGIAVVFVELGQQVHVEGSLPLAIERGVAEGYTKGFLRASIVSDPFLRVNTENNTPPIIHYEIAPGENIKITVCPKGAGSENKSRLAMLTPADGIEGVKDFVLETVRLADANSCPPMVVGVGVGSNMEGCALLAKKALLKRLDEVNPEKRLAKLETELLEKINSLGIGPAGTGGRVSALKVNVLSAPTHIAQLPVAVNISCHVLRHSEILL